jgi:hypothetical protein
MSRDCGLSSRRLPFRVVAAGLPPPAVLGHRSVSSFGDVDNPDGNRRWPAASTAYVKKPHTSVDSALDMIWIENLWDLCRRLKSGRYRAPAIRRVYIPKTKRKAPAARHHHDRGSRGAESGGVGALGCIRARLLGVLAGFQTKAKELLSGLVENGRRPGARKVKEAT